MKMNRRLICIHGFLGKGSDWDFLQIPMQEASIQLEAVELEQDFREWRLEQSLNAFASWAENFISQVRQKCEGDLRPPLLLGYSMGGRLAIEALIQAPDLFGGALLVSTNPGLRADAQLEREARVVSDELWAKRFESESWTTLMKDWNAQSVFQGGVVVPERREDELDRRILSAQLRGWSLGKQADRLAVLSQCELPLLWVVGGRDDRYVKLSREVENVLSKKASFRVQRIPQAGHRVPWDQPELFLERLQDWIFGLNLGRVEALGVTLE